VKNKANIGKTNPILAQNWVRFGFVWLRFLGGFRAVRRAEKLRNILYCKYLAMSHGQDARGTNWVRFAKKGLICRALSTVVEELNIQHRTSNIELSIKKTNSRFWILDNPRRKRRG